MDPKVEPLRGAQGRAGVRAAHCVCVCRCVGVCVCSQACVRLDTRVCGSVSRPPSCLVPARASRPDGAPGRRGEPGASRRVPSRRRSPAAAGGGGSRSPRRCAPTFQPRGPRTINLLKCKFCRQN